LIEPALTMMADNMWAVYLGLFFAPFVQEDAAVLGAASLAASQPASAPLVLLIGWMGLSTSDVWKYWLGAAARRQPWAKKFAERPSVRSAGDVVRSRMGSAILAARFVPGTRIALYIAAGYFAAPFARFAVYILATAALLLVGLFIVFWALGDVLGDRAVLYVSAAALTGLIGWFGVKFAVAKFNQRSAP